MENNTLLRLEITYPNASLRVLRLMKNRLSVLGLGYFTVLSELDVNSNEIVVVNLPSSVEKVNLSHNMLKNVGFISKLNVL